MRSPLALALMLCAVLTAATGCRKRRAATPKPAPAPEAASEPQAATPATAPATGVAASPPPPVATPNFETSTEFDDLSKDFELYCARKGRVPTDLNEFFREQRIKPPQVPPGARLAIDRESRRIILVR